MCLRCLDRINFASISFRYRVLLSKKLLYWTCYVTRHLKKRWAIRLTFRNHWHLQWVFQHRSSFIAVLTCHNDLWKKGKCLSLAPPGEDSYKAVKNNKISQLIPAFSNPKSIRGISPSSLWQRGLRASWRSILVTLSTFGNSIWIYT